MKTSFRISRGVFEKLAFLGFQRVFLEKKKKGKLELKKKLMQLGSPSPNMTAQKVSLKFDRCALVGMLTPPSPTSL